jgi:DNA-binding winged helix-turn-helix (wHTH) protein
MERNRQLVPSDLTEERYAFAEFELDLSTSDLRRNDRSLKLNAKSLDVLAYLLKNRDRAVPGTELMRAVWPDVRVNSGSVRQAIWEIRRALHQPGRAEIIETAWGRGYRFTAAVERRSAGSPAGQVSPLAFERWASGLGGEELLTLLESLLLVASRKGLSKHFAERLPPSASGALKGGFSNRANPSASKEEGVRM